MMSKERRKPSKSLKNTALSEPYFHTTKQEGIVLRKKPVVICVDFDGCIASYRKGWLGVGRFGLPIPGAREALTHLRQSGYYVVVYTVRGDTNGLRKWLSRYRVPYDSINWHPFGFPDQDGRKVPADIYVDDRAVAFNGFWQLTLSQIKHFRRWEE